MMTLHDRFPTATGEVTLGGRISGCPLQGRPSVLSAVPSADC